MYENVKIGIIGGDMRQVALSRRLSELGFKVVTWGLKGDADIGNATRCDDWHAAVEESKAVILPLPVSADGIRVFAPECDGCELRISQLFGALDSKTLLIGGKFDMSIKESAKENNIPLLDYFECEELQIKNAVPTAEGALEIAMRELSVTISGAKAFVCGYGRIGKVLSSLLKAMGAVVYTSARKLEDIAYITVNGCVPVRYTDAEFIEYMSQADVIFNTVPAKVIDKNVISKLKKGSLIIDLASGKGGTDFEFAKACNVKCIHALSLPGKVAPETAGYIICDCVLEMLLREGVIAKL